MKTPHRIGLALVLGLAAGAAILGTGTGYGDLGRQSATLPPAAQELQQNPQLTSSGFDRRPSGAESSVSATARSDARELDDASVPAELPRLRRISGVAPALVELELVDAATGAPVPAAAVCRTGPGLEPERRAAVGGAASFEVHQRLPFDLRIEAEGYEPREVRQTRLAQGEALRQLRVALHERR